MNRRFQILRNLVDQGEPEYGDLHSDACLCDCCKDYEIESADFVCTGCGNRFNKQRKLVATRQKCGCGLGIYIEDVSSISSKTV